MGALSLRGWWWGRGHWLLIERGAHPACIMHACLAVRVVAALSSSHMNRQHTTGSSTVCWVCICGSVLRSYCCGHLSLTLMHAMYLSHRCTLQSMAATCWLSSCSGTAQQWTAATQQEQQAAAHTPAWCRSYTVQVLGQQVQVVQREVSVVCWATTGLVAAVGVTWPMRLSLRQY